MNVKIMPFGWLDLPKLLSNRHRSVILDISLVLTHGPQLIPGVLFSFLAPSMGVFTCTNSRDSDSNITLIAQAIHQPGSQYSHMTFITPETAMGSPLLNQAVDYLTKVTGQRGAYHLLADVDEYHPAYASMRSAGFATYSRQRVWQLEGKPQSRSSQFTWKAATSIDGPSIRSLYNNLVPPMIQQVEPFSLDTPNGMVLRQDGELVAFVELRYGHRGIWVQPLVHPDINEVPGKFNSLVNSMIYRRGRPIYLCIRSYLFWLESALEKLDAKPGTTQALMVKHMTVPKKALQPYEIPVIEGSQPEATASVMNLENR